MQDMQDMQENESLINPIQNDLDDNNVSFSNETQFNEDDDDKLNIIDSPVVLDGIESLDDPVLDNIEVLG